MLSKTKKEYHPTVETTDSAYVHECDLQMKSSLLALVNEIPEGIQKKGISLDGWNKRARERHFGVKEKHFPFSLL